MLTHLAMLEGAAERRIEDITRSGDQRAPGPGAFNDVMRSAAMVRTKVQDARMAEQELLRLQGCSPMEIATSIDGGLERGRHAEATDLVMGAIAGREL